MGRTPEEHLALANINPELEQILKTSPPAPPFDPTIDIQQLRNLILARKQPESTTAEEASYVEEDRGIPVRDGSSITVRIHKPKALPIDGCPIFVVYHLGAVKSGQRGVTAPDSTPGSRLLQKRLLNDRAKSLDSGGGFTLGDLDNEAILCRNFTKLGGIAVNVDYRLAPEHPFPVPVQDAYDALKWTAAHFEELGGNPQKGFIVGGISAGANFAAIISHLSRDDKISPPLSGTFLSMPPCMVHELVPEKYKAVFLSREQKLDTEVLNKDVIQLFARLYNSDKSSPLAHPMAFKSHAGLPPTYFQICGMDPLRDEGLIYEEILREENGVQTLLDIYPGLPHGFWAIWTEASFSKKLHEDSVKGMKWLLEQSK